MISKMIVKTPGGQVTVYGGVYVDGVLIGWNLRRTRQYKIPVRHILSKRLTWVSDDRWRAK